MINGLIFVKKTYKTYSNWTPILIELTDSFIRAEKNITGKTSGIKRGSNPVNKDYLNELDIIINNLLTENQYDLAFIDAGIHFRGDIVNTF